MPRQTVSTAAAREIAATGTILRGTVGSTVHGLHIEAQDDRDEMAEGRVPYDEVVEWIDRAERDLERAHAATRLPEHPDGARIDAWLVHAYTTAWRDRSGG